MRQKDPYRLQLIVLLELRMNPNASLQFRGSFEVVDGPCGV